MRNTVLTIHSSVAVSRCPVCDGVNTTLVAQRHSLDEVAEYFVPERRSPSRHAAVGRVLQRLWNGSEEVVVRNCADCGFGFATPFVAGDTEFYSVVYQGDPHYPRDRWEFSRTSSVLAHLVEDQRPAELLEAGAGYGWFLRKLQAQPQTRHLTMTALEYDAGALRRLREIGVTAVPGSLVDLSEDPDQRARYRFICLFQTLEHMDQINEAFAAMRRLGTADAHVFISAPYRPAIEAEERAVGFSEMPPQHVGRWTRESLEFMANRHGFRLHEWALQPKLPRYADAWVLAVYRAKSRADQAATFEHIVQAIGFRPLRGVLKRVAAVRWLPAMWSSAGTMLNHNQWAHLVRVPSRLGA